MARKLQVAFVFVLTVLCGCGTPGAPQPPSLEIPKAIADLKATRKGNVVTLNWTQPTKTTDGMLIKNPGKVSVCRSASNDPKEPKCVDAAPSGPLGKYTETLDDPIKGFTTDAWNYTVTAENRRGRSIGKSNTASVPIAHVDFAVSQFTTTLADDGVHIHFQTSQLPRIEAAKSAYTVEIKTLRAEKDKDIFTRLNKDLLVVTERTKEGGSEWEMVDDSIEWEKTYQYKVAALITVYGQKTEPLGSFESDDSNTVEIFTHDIFPPDPPQNPQAVANSVGNERSVDLSWTPNPERDLAGYNVYRREPEFSTKLEKINSDLLRGASFKDPNVKAGHRYEYVITAVDVHNNESKPSAPAEEKVPQ